ncbi:MAG: cell division protein FtsK, partial [Comamonadaceae bacterium CG_4_9_14_0_8_um_filter_60_18]
MTYSLHNLAGQRAAAGQDASRDGWRRFSSEISLVLGFIALAVWLVSMVTYSPLDTAWSTSGVGAAANNRLGQPGAWLADASYYLLGYSVWWCFAAAARAWLGAFARRLRGGDDAFAHQTMDAGAAPSRALAQAWFWLGLVLLVCASAALEWTRFYSHEANLPGHGGGIPGYFLGPLGMQWLGFTGSGLVAISVGVLGSAMVFGFSWLLLAERLGAWLFAQIETRREKIAFEEDIALGQQAAQARAQVLVEERQEESAPSQAKPAVRVVEAAPVELPKSERVQKERQKPLFQDLPDTKLPQVDLLDAALTRQETVAAETLEMTSRM